MRVPITLCFLLFATPCFAQDKQTYETRYLNEGQLVKTVTAGKNPWKDQKDIVLDGRTYRFAEEATLGPGRNVRVYRLKK